MGWIILLWLTVGALTAAAAGAKNRSRLGWFFLGLMFPLPALLIVIAFPSKPSAEKLAQERDSRPCPFCAEPIKKAAIKCKHCGSDIEPDKSYPLTTGWIVSIPCQAGEDLLKTLAKLKELDLPIIPSESTVVAVGPFETQREASALRRRLIAAHYITGSLDFKRE